MTETFETTLARLKSQESDFDSRDEHAVEIGAVLPLLRQVGWNTENISEIYPQHGLPDGSRVDYDLQIDGESRILIEVKRWAHTLDDEDEEQLADYCRLAKPKLAVLTSGRSWRLYLPPTRGKSTPLRKFLDFDITTVQPMEAESAFRSFLARDSMLEFKPTEYAANRLHREIQGLEKLKEVLTEAWNELATDKDALAEFVLGSVDISRYSAFPCHCE